MPDNVTLPGTGTVVATDEVNDGAGLRQFQIVKIAHGADGTATQASATSPLPVSITANASATGAASATHLVSATSTNATSVKASPGRVLGWSFGNTNGAWRYVKLHNTAGTPTAGAGVVRTIAIPPNGLTNATIEGGIAFTTGIGLTAVVGSADSDANQVSVGDIIGELFWV